MQERKLKNILGIFLIISHFGLIITVFIFYKLGGFLFDEMTTSIALIVPMFAAFTSAIVAFMVKNRHVFKKKSKRVNSVFMFVSFFIPSLFVVILFLIVILKAFNYAFATFEQFKITLTIVDGIFAVYIGQILSSLFDVKLSKQVSQT